MCVQHLGCDRGAVLVDSSLIDDLAAAASCRPGSRSHSIERCAPGRCGRHSRDPAGSGWLKMMRPIVVSTTCAGSSTPLILHGPADLDWAPAGVIMSCVIGHDRLVACRGRPCRRPSRPGLIEGQVVAAQDHILRRDRDGLAVGGLQAGCWRPASGSVASACASADSGTMHSHLVAVEVGVEGGADQRVQLDARVPSTRTGSKAWMPRRCSVGARFSMHRVVLDDGLPERPKPRGARAPPSCLAVLMLSAVPCLDQVAS